MAVMKAIVAVDRDWAIGKDGNLLYHIPEDMEFFKETTINHVVVMGRKTFDSIGDKKLLRRKNIVLTHNSANYKNSASRTFMSFNKFNTVFEKDSSNRVYFIIGGEEVYKKYYRQCREIYVTMIDAEAKDPDRYFPDLNYCKEFKLDKVLGSGMHNGIKYKFTKWVKV